MIIDSSIDIEFARAKEQEQKLRDISEKLLRLSGGTYEDTLNSITSSWKGDNSIRYVDKGRHIQDNITAVANEVKKTADVLQEIIKNLYDAEMKSSETAEVRVYH